MDDSERRMRRRVKRVRRRVREGTTFTPQVARNYRMDMWRTPATPQYAYRPADSMTHMFRTKYDMIHQFNADLHQQEIRNIQAETEISKLQHQRKMAEKKTREYEREKILALQDKLAADYPTCFDGYDYLDFSGRVSLGWMTQDISQNGAVGDPVGSTAEEGERWLSSVTDMLCQAFEEIRGFSFREDGSGQDPAHD